MAHETIPQIQCCCHLDPNRPKEDYHSSILGKQFCLAPMTRNLYLYRLFESILSKVGLILRTAFPTKPYDICLFIALP